VTTLPSLQQPTCVVISRMLLCLLLTGICCCPHHRKVAKAYFALLEVLCHNHTGTIACQDAPTFSFILNSLDQVRECATVDRARVHSSSQWKGELKY
jgi:hypothetical protein